jgi:hypothetical protein
MASSDDDSYEVIVEPTSVGIFSFGRSSPFSETSDESWTKVVSSTQQRSQQSSLVVSGVRSMIDHHHHHQAQKYSDDEKSVDTQEFENIKEDVISIMCDTESIECHNPPDTFLIVWDPSAITTGTPEDQVADTSKQEANPEYLPAVHSRATLLTSPTGLLGNDGFAAEQPRVAATPLNKKTFDGYTYVVDQF